MTDIKSKIMNGQKGQGTWNEPFDPNIVNVGFDRLHVLALAYISEHVLSERREEIQKLYGLAGIRAFEYLASKIELIKSESK